MSMHFVKIFSLYLECWKLYALSSKFLVNILYNIRITIYLKHLENNLQSWPFIFVVTLVAIGVAEGGHGGRCINPPPHEITIDMHISIQNITNT